MSNTITLANTRGLSREDWLAVRRRGIGSSDAAAVVGLSPYTSRLALYLDKIGEMPDQEQNEYMEAGNLLEPVVAELFERRTGLKPRHRFAVLASKEHPFMLANLDRTLPARNGDGPGLLECKTTGASKRDVWEDDQAPLSAVLQVQHQLAVTGYTWAYLAVLIGGNNFKWTLVERDEDLIAGLVEAERVFWMRVQDRDPDPGWIDGSESTSAALKALYPHSVPESQVVLPPDAANLIAEYLNAAGKERAWSETKDQAANRLKDLLGEAEAGYLPGVERPVVTWRQSVSHRWDVKLLEEKRKDLARKYKTTSTSRRLVVKEL
jgi:putative phage-type endonuclease